MPTSFDLTQAMTGAQQRDESAAVKGYAGFMFIQSGSSNRPVSR